MIMNTGSRGRNWVKVDFEFAAIRQIVPCNEPVSGFVLDAHHDFVKDLSMVGVRANRPSSNHVGLRVIGKTCNPGGALH